MGKVRSRFDVMHDTSMVPDSDHAERLTRLIDGVRASGEQGRRETASGWLTR